MTFSFCSTDHNQVFLNGEKPLKIKGKCTCVHFKTAAVSLDLIIHSEKSCMIWFIEYDTSTLPSNSAELKINGTMLYYNVWKNLKKIT